MAVVKARRLRPRAAAGGPRRPRRRRHLARCRPAGRGARPARRGRRRRRCSPGCHVPGTTSAAPSTPTSTSPSSATWALDDVVAAARERGPDRPACSSRSTPVSGAERRPHGLASATGRRGPPPRGRGRRRGRRGLVALRLRRRAGAPDGARTAGALRRGGGRAVERAGCEPERAPPGQLRGHPDQPRRRTSTWCARASPSTGCPRCPTSATRTHFGLRPAMRVTARLTLVKRVPRRPGRQLRARLRHRRATPCSAWCRSGTPTASRATPPNVGPVLGRRAAPDPSPAGCAWTSSSSTSGRRLAGAGRRRGRRLRAPPPTASRPRRTGPTRPAPSATRSSPGSGRGCPGVLRRRARVSSSRNASSAWASALGVAGAAAAAGSSPTARAGAASDALETGVSLVQVPDRDAASSTADDGVALHVEIDEPKSGAGPTPRSVGRTPTVVLSHGFCLTSASAGCFQRRDAAAAAGYRVVTWDQRGHGQSGRGGPSSPTRSPSSGADLAAVIDAAAPEGPLVLVGHSMGGMTMMALGGQDPDLVRERVVAVALISTSPGGAEMPSSALGRSSRRPAGRLARLERARPACRGHVRAPSRSAQGASARRAGPAEFLVERYSFALAGEPRSVVLLARR